MAIGVVDDSEFESELSKLTPVIKEEPRVYPEVEVIDAPTRGRGAGNIEVPNSLRKIIGETSETEGRKTAIDLAKNFGISQSSVSAYANGATSTSSYRDSKQSIREHIDKAKERISKKARARLNLALGHITSDKLEAANLKVISSVARDMSAIVRDMEPPEVKNPLDANSPTFVFYSPQFKKEEDFETIILKE